MQYLFTNARDFSASAVVAVLDGVVCAIRRVIPAQANARVIAIFLIARRRLPLKQLSSSPCRRSSCPLPAGAAAEAPDRWDQDASAPAGRRRPLLSNCASVYIRPNPPCRRGSVS